MHRDWHTPSKSKSNTYPHGNPASRNQRVRAPPWCQNREARQGIAAEPRPPTLPPPEYHCSESLGVVNRLLRRTPRPQTPHARPRALSGPVMEEIKSHGTARQPRGRPARGPRGADQSTTLAFRPSSLTQMQSRTTPEQGPTFTAMIGALAAAGRLAFKDGPA